MLGTAGALGTGVRQMPRRHTVPSVGDRPQRNVRHLGGYLPRERFALRNTIRSWAQAIGMACPPIGGVPVPVQIAYLRFHTEVAA